LRRKKKIRPNVDKIKNREKLIEIAELMNYISLNSLAISRTSKVAIMSHKKKCSAVFFSSPS